MKKNKPFILHKDIEPYRHLITNTGGNNIEDLMTRYYNEDNLMQINMPVACLGMCVESQITLIHRMIEDGVLK